MKRMRCTQFPDMVKNLKKRDYGISGLEVYVDHTASATIYFVQADREIAFPPHRHAAQWTVVINGRCAVTIDGKTSEYAKGDTYYIPADTEHQITLYPGYMEMDYVDDPRDGEEE